MDMWSDEDEIKAKEMLKILKPCKFAVEALSRHDATLLTSVGVFNFLFDSLNNNKNDLSEKMLSELHLQLSKRRDIQLVSLAKFLNDPKRYGSGNNFLRTSSKSEIIKMAKSLVSRLFSDANSNLLSEEPDNDDQTLLDSDDVVPPATAQTEDEYLKQKLEESIRASTSVSTYRNDCSQTLNKEFQLFEKTGEITPTLKLLKDAVLTVRPTSTQNERNFSTSGNIVSKRRTSLSDKAVDTLCFLKFHFAKQNDS